MHPVVEFSKSPHARGNERRYRISSDQNLLACIAVGMLLTLSPLLSCGRLDRTWRDSTANRTCLCGKVVRCRDCVRRVKHNRLWSAAGNGIPPNVFRRHVKALGDVEKQHLAFRGYRLHRLTVEV